VQAVHLTKRSGSTSGEVKVRSYKFQRELPKVTKKSPVTDLSGALVANHTSWPGWATILIVVVKVLVLVHV
jgi:hypothetical protein